MFLVSIKYEHIYLSPTNGGNERYEGIRKYIEFYNSERRHASINNNPSEKYFNLIKMISKNKPKFKLSLSQIMGELYFE